MLAVVILVVDDDAEIRETVRSLLVDEGYAVREACDGAQAIEALGALGDEPCLVLLDMMMPVMDGEAFLRVLRETNQLDDVPVLILSATKPTHAASAGARMCLHKPIDMDVLLRAIRTLCADHPSLARTRAVPEVVEPREPRRHVR